MMVQSDRKRPIVGMGLTDSSRSDISSSRPGRRANAYRGWYVLLTTTLFCFSRSAAGQLIGTDLCGCQPATYTFTFDFALTCDDTDVEGPGINETACLTEIRGKEDVPDDQLVPVTVQTVQIFELDQNLQVFSQTVRTGTFDNGSNFTYTSIISTITDLENVDALPRGLQLVITGLNANEEATVNTYIITYFNDCGIFPILTEGQTAGWTIFSELGDPPTSICPLSPSVAPTSGPGTTAPTSRPTVAPSIAPVTPGTPTRGPITTEAPIVPDTDAPAVIPDTDAPVVAPSITQPPATDAPNTSDTAAPSCPTGGKGTGGNSKSGSGMSGKGVTDSSKSGKGDSGSKSGGKSSMSGKGGMSGGDGKSGMSGGKEGLRKKDVIYGGQMDRIKNGESDRFLATGEKNVFDECPDNEIDEPSKSGKGQGGKGKSGGSKSGSKSKSKSGKNLMKKPMASDKSSKSMDIGRSTKGKGKGGGKSGKGGSDGDSKSSGKGSNSSNGSSVDDTENQASKSGGTGKGQR